MSWKKSILVTCKILRLFVHTWTADDKCFLLNRDNLRQSIQILLSEKKKNYQCFSAILNSRLNFNFFQKSDVPHSLVISEITDSKNMAKMSKKSRFRGSFDKQHGIGDQTFFKPEPDKFDHIYWSVLSQLSWKKSLLVICKMIGLFAKTLNASNKNSLLNR